VKGDMNGFLVFEDYLPRFIDFFCEFSLHLSWKGPFVDYKNSHFRVQNRVQNKYDLEPRLSTKLSTNLMKVHFCSNIFTSSLGLLLEKPGNGANPL